MCGAIRPADPAAPERRGGAGAGRRREEAVHHRAQRDRARRRTRRPRGWPGALGASRKPRSTSCRRRANAALSRKPCSSRAATRLSICSRGPARRALRSDLGLDVGDRRARRRTARRSPAAERQQDDGRGVAGGVAQRQVPLAVLLDGKRLDVAQARGGAAHRLRDSSEPRPRRSCAASTSSADLDVLVDLVRDEPVAGPAGDDRDAERHPQDRPVGRAGHAAEARRAAGGLAHRPASSRAPAARCAPRAWPAGSRSPAATRWSRPGRPASRRWHATSISLATASASGPGVSRMSSVACAAEGITFDCGTPCTGASTTVGVTVGGRRWRTAPAEAAQPPLQRRRLAEQRAQRGDRVHARPPAWRRGPCGRAPSPGPTRRRAARGTARSARARR